MLSHNSQMHSPMQEESQQERPQHRHKTAKTRSIQRPWWQRSIVGYISAFPLVASAIGLTVLAEKLLAPHEYFPSVFLTLAILFTSTFWGVGPGLLALGLCCMTFLSPSLPPAGLVFSVFSWQWTLEILPFALAGLVVNLLAGQRETARRRAMQAEHVAKAQADDLAILNNELQEADQLKDLFLSIASHELKTPITTIRGQAQLALRALKKGRQSLSDPEVWQDKFRMVEEQTDRLTDLINKLLDLSTLRSGKLVLELASCNLNEICTQVVEEQRALSKRTIDLQLSTHPIPLTADARRLTQVFTNLISNALKYSPDKSPVTVKVTHDQQVALVSVQDTGDGIPAEQAARIFEPFYRTSDARASSVTGSGLGLTISKNIIERHQGRIWYTSRPESGSTFFVELPLTPPPGDEDRTFA